MKLEEYLNQKKTEYLAEKQELVKKLQEGHGGQDVTGASISYKQGKIDLINDILCHLGDCSVKYDMNNGIEDYE